MNIPNNYNFVIYSLQIYAIVTLSFIKGYQKLNGQADSQEKPKTGTTPPMASLLAGIGSISQIF